MPGGGTDGGMDVPDIVGERLADESQLTSVSIGNDDRVYVTPSRTLVYHSAGLFRSESVEEYPHDAARFDVSAGRREASFAFEYADSDVRGFSIPRDRIETVLPPVIAGVLRSTGLIDDDEEIIESYRFGERTLVVADRRLLTSVGEAVWDREFESYAYEDVTGVDFKAGTLLVAVEGRQRRLDLSGEGDREAYRTIENALCAFHDVDTLVEIGLQGTDELRPEPSASDDGAADQSATTHETTDREPANPDTPDHARVESPDAAVREVNASTEQSSSRPARSSDDTHSADDGQPVDADRSPNPLSEPGDASTEPAVSIDDATDRPPETALSDDADAAAIVDELDALRETVDRQTELLERQQTTLERLVDEATDDE